VGFLPKNVAGKAAAGFFNERSHSKSCGRKVAPKVLHRQISPCLFGTSFNAFSEKLLVPDWSNTSIHSSLIFFYFLPSAKPHLELRILYFCFVSQH
jgi:hypothetical protein